MPRSLTGLLICLVLGCIVATCVCGRRSGGSANSQESSVPPLPRDTLPVISPDGKHYSYVATVDGKQVVVMDGRVGEPYAEVKAQWERHGWEGPPTFRPGIQFSATGGHFAYAARIRGKWAMVVDGHLGDPYDDLDMAVFNRDGTRVAYPAKKGEVWEVVCDGTEGKAYERIMASSGIYAMFSPDGSRLAYVGVNQESPSMARWLHYVVVDGKEGQPCFHLWEVLFSPDSQHVAYAGERDYDQQWVLVRDGQASRPYKLIRSVTFSSDSSRLAFAAEDKRGHFMVVDDSAEPVYERVSQPVFSPDSRRFAYVARTAEKEFLVVDGVPAETRFDQVLAPRFSPDSRRVAHKGREGEKWYMVIDSQGGPQFQDLWTVVFSPDSLRVAYRGSSQDGARVVVDGEHGPLYKAWLSSPVFSADSRRVAYSVRLHEGGGFVVLDGQEGKQYARVSGAGPVFDPAGSHLLYKAMDSGREFIVLDATENKPHDRVVGDVFFDAPDVYAYFAIDGGEIRRVTETLQ